MFDGFEWDVSGPSIGKPELGPESIEGIAGTPAQQFRLILSVVYTSLFAVEVV
jgi:hypothetical protein